MLGGKGCGNEDEDVRAGAWRRPRGSLRFATFERSNIDPIAHHQYRVV